MIFRPRALVKKLVCFSGLYLCALNTSFTFGQSVPLEPVDVLCGPRCITFVLNELGISCELKSVIEELKSPSVDQGLSLNQIRRVFENRGVRTRPVRLTPGERLTHGSPAIVHFSPDKTNNRYGHFMVWMPQSTAESVVAWDGLNGMTTHSSPEFYSNVSSIALLIAGDEENSHAASKTFEIGPTLPSIGSAVAVALTTITIYLSLPFFRRIRQ